MLLKLSEFFGNIFDKLHYLFEHQRVQGRLATCIFWIFILGLSAVEAKRLGLLPSSLANLAPLNHFEVINLAFTLILALELLSLVFAISCSISRALAKQFQLLCLILLRNAFKELSHLHEPLAFASDWPTIFNIGCLGLAALVVFVCLGLYRRLPQPPTPMSGEDRMRYVLSKKMLGLVLLFIFACIALGDLWHFFNTGDNTGFFESIYTVLIFADLALVLMAQRFMRNFHATFRNAAFVLATLLIRIALGTPPPWDALVGVAAALYALALAWAIRHLAPQYTQPKPAAKQ